MAMQLLRSKDTLQKDKERGIEWLRLYAAQGNKHGLRKLGNCYAKGRGVEKNFVEAYKFWLMASHKGDEKAPLKIASLFLHGKGVKKNVELAKRWLGTAMERKVTIPDEEEFRSLM